APKGRVHTRRAFRAGRLAAKKLNMPGPDRGSQPEAALINREWWKFRHARRSRVKSWKAYHAESRAFVRGYCRGARIAFRDQVMLPTGQSVAAVITARNERDTLQLLL